MSGLIPGPDPGACPDCGGWRKAGVAHRCEDTPVPTWREALIEAFAAVDAAYENRAGVVKAAHDAGLSLRVIAEVVGISAAGVHRIIGKSNAPRDAELILNSAALSIASSREGGS